LSWLVISEYLAAVECCSPIPHAVHVSGHTSHASTLCLNGICKESEKSNGNPLTMAFSLDKLDESGNIAGEDLVSVCGEMSTMVAGLWQFEGELSSGRLSRTRTLIARWFLPALFAFCGIFLAPSVTHADFIVGAGQASASESPLSALLYDQIGCGSSAAGREAPSHDALPRKGNHEPVRPSAFAPIPADAGGCTSSSSPTSGGPAGSLGLTSERLAAIVPVCTGRIAVGAPLDVPSPMAARLLDPPRCLAQV